MAGRVAEPIVQRGSSLGGAPMLGAVDAYICQRLEASESLPGAVRIHCPVVVVERETGMTRECREVIGLVRLASAEPISGELAAFAHLFPFDSRPLHILHLLRQKSRWMHARDTCRSSRSLKLLIAELSPGKCSQVQHYPTRNALQA